MCNKITKGLHNLKRQKSPNDASVNQALSWTVNCSAISTTCTGQHSVRHILCNSLFESMSREGVSFSAHLTLLERAVAVAFLSVCLSVRPSVRKFWLQNRCCDCISFDFSVGLNWCMPFSFWSSAVAEDAAHLSIFAHFYLWFYFVMFVILDFYVYMYSVLWRAINLLIDWLRWFLCEFGLLYGVFRYFSSHA